MMASRRRLNASLDMVAVRSSSFNGSGLRPSGTDDVHDRMDSPILGRSASAGPVFRGMLAQRLEPLRPVTNQPVKVRYSSERKAES